MKTWKCRRCDTNNNLTDGKCRVCETPKSRVRGPKR